MNSNNVPKKRINFKKTKIHSIVKIKSDSRNKFAEIGTENFTLGSKKDLSCSDVCLETYISIYLDSVRQRDNESSLKSFLCEFPNCLKYFLKELKDKKILDFDIEKYKYIEYQVDDKKLQEVNDRLERFIELTIREIALKQIDEKNELQEKAARKNLELLKMIQPSEILINGKSIYSIKNPKKPTKFEAILISMIYVSIAQNYRSPKNAKHFAHFFRGHEDILKANGFNSEIIPKKEDLRGHEGERENTPALLKKIIGKTYDDRCYVYNSVTLK